MDRLMPGGEKLLMRNAQVGISALVSQDVRHRIVKERGEERWRPRIARCQ